MKFTWWPAASRCSWVSGNPTFVAITVGRLRHDALPELDREVELEEEAVGVDHHREIGDGLAEVGEEARPRSPSSASATTAGPTNAAAAPRSFATRIWRTTSRVPSAVVPHHTGTRPATVLDDRAVERELLVPQQRRALAGRAAQTDRGGTVVDHLVGEAGRLVEVERVGIGPRCSPSALSGLGGSASRPVTSAALNTVVSLRRASIAGSCRACPLT